MDLNAYHRAWMNGATEAEAVRAGEDAYFENQAYAAQERAADEAMERDDEIEEAYEHEQRLIAEPEANIVPERSEDMSDKQTSVLFWFLAASTMAFWGAVGYFAGRAFL